MKIFGFEIKRQKSINEKLAKINKQLDIIKQSANAISKLLAHNNEENSMENIVVSFCETENIKDALEEIKQEMDDK